MTDLEGQESHVAAATVVACDLSYVNSACAALETDCTGQGFCYDVNSMTCEYLAEKQLEWDVCDTVGSTSTVAACVSSIEDTSSPNASTDTNCGFIQYWSNPTVFPIDCRCSDAAFEAHGKRPYELSSVVTSKLAARSPSRDYEQIPARVNRFDVHAGVAIAAHARAALEKLLAYLARPPVPSFRLRQLDNGNVAFDLKRMWARGVKTWSLGRLHSSPDSQP